MKKIFLFAAAVVAAMTVNAASFTGFDGRGGDLGAQIASGLLADENNVTLVETSTGKYSIQNTDAGDMSFTLGGVLFFGSDANAKKDIYKTYNTYIQPNGARRTATGTEIVLWSDDRAETPTAAKFKLGVILPATAQGVENVDAAAKAIKSFENGQLVIIKNGVKYNALGAKF